MTDEEEERVRSIIHKEAQALLLRVQIQHNIEDLQFINDIQWHYPRAYGRIRNEVLAKFNADMKRIDKLKDEIRRSEHD